MQWRENGFGQEFCCQDCKFAILTRYVSPNGGEAMKASSLLNRIAVDPKIMIGKPVIKGTRLPVEIIVEKVAYGASFQEILEDYPFLTENDIKAALLYSARRLSLEETYASQ